MTTTPARLGILIQGPIYTSLKAGSTRDVLLRVRELQRQVSGLEDAVIACSFWKDEPRERVAELATLADRVVLVDKPADGGSGNRNYQAHSVSAGLAVLSDCSHVLKTRTDILLSASLLQRLLTRTREGFDRLLVTDSFTRYEPFHISDLLVFSTRENVRLYFEPGEAAYEDLYSPEVQFARVFIRRKQLDYLFDQTSYLRFLRDWVEVVNFNDEGLIWLKQPDYNRRKLDRRRGLCVDRSFGPVLTRLVTAEFIQGLSRRNLPLLALRLQVQDALMNFFYTRWALPHRIPLVRRLFLCDRYAIAPAMVTEIQRPVGPGPKVSYQKWDPAPVRVGTPEQVAGGAALD